MVQLAIVGEQSFHCYSIGESKTQVDRPLRRAILRVSGYAAIIQQRARHGTSPSDWRQGTGRPRVISTLSLSARARRRFFRSADRRVVDPSAGAEAVRHSSNNLEVSPLHLIAQARDPSLPSTHK